ncbi:SDR family NAD(P)-dependent oxidoreductase [Devosia faecipullorum]|uniref:SDR family NAD(P)-dependent oxidoreductase n=1 Tax=Devosia faecipullorum TaxID=2755039 RepID=UPI001E4CD1CF|nr:SDR family oxidoreductase [Devosia faecipullorum]
MKLAGKAAVITGAGGGLGQAMANTFAAEGAQVALLDVNADLVTAAAAAVPGGRGRAYVVDVRDRLAVKAAIDDFAARQGGLDILVNNAVAFSYAPLVDMEEDIVDRMLDIGIKGVFWSLQAGTPHLIARGGGAVINLSSIAVSFSIKNAAVYTSIKGALDALTRQQAVELGAHGIRVNAIAPGSVETPGASSVIDAQGWESRKARTPLKRLATPEEVAAAALFLVSDDAKSIAGVTLKIDAGITIAGP